jgi:hypothetical protein
MVRLTSGKAQLQNLKFFVTPVGSPLQSTTSGLGLSDPMPFQALASGQLAGFSVPAGRFAFLVEGLEDDLFVADLIQGGKSVYDDGFLAGADPRIEIVLADRGARIVGAVRDTQGNPVSFADVALIPKQQRRQNKTFFKSVTTDSSGLFTFRGLPPDEYQLLAMKNMVTGAVQNPQYLADHALQTVAVQVNLGETRSNVLVPLAE